MNFRLDCRKTLTLIAGWLGVNAIDQRIIQQTREGKRRVINSETESGGYPVMKETRQSFNPSEWDLRTMERRSPTGAK